MLSDKQSSFNNKNHTEMKKTIKKIVAKLKAPKKYEPRLNDSGIYLMYTTYAERGMSHIRI